jgi:hypothetical protein
VSDSITPVAEYWQRPTKRPRVVNINTSSTSPTVVSGCPVSLMTATVCGLILPNGPSMISRYPSACSGRRGGSGITVIPWRSLERMVAAERSRSAISRFARASPTLPPMSPKYVTTAAINSSVRAVATSTSTRVKPAALQPICGRAPPVISVTGLLMQFLLLRPTNRNAKPTCPLLEPAQCFAANWRSTSKAIIGQPAAYATRPVQEPSARFPLLAARLPAKP